MVHVIFYSHGTLRKQMWVFLRENILISVVWFNFCFSIVPFKFANTSASIGAKRCASNDNIWAMRMKTFLIIFGCVVIISYFIVMLSSASDQNDSIKTIVTRTHHHIKKIHVSIAMHKSLPFPWMLEIQVNCQISLK